MDDIEINTKPLDHLGIVAGVARDLGLVKKINSRLLIRQDISKVSMGHRVLAMIINGLGFTNNRLYLMPEFFSNRPIKRLLGADIQAEELNQYSLGDALDAISKYGASQLFAELAFEIGKERGLIGKFAHLDTTSLSLHGDYNVESEEGPNVTYGYSKDRRYDLKQVIMSLTVTGASSFPIWVESLDGNASDKKSLHQTIQKMHDFSEQLKASANFIWVADSALYTPNKLLSAQDLEWVSRVPETIKDARLLLEEPDETYDWLPHETKGYRYTTLGSKYGGLNQRWVIVSSESAYKREKKTLDKNILKEQEQVSKLLDRLGREIYSCESDAQKALLEKSKKLSFHVINSTIEPVEKYVTKGRPNKDTPKKVVGFKICGEVFRNEEAIQKHLNRKGRYIVASNVLDSKQISDSDLIKEYKNQSSVEKGFRFLKDPWFMVDSVFLKSPKRIEALMVIMALCLMVYNIAQYEFRESLKAKNDTIPNQIKRETNTPTLRWVFQLMDGIALVRIFADKMQGVYKEIVSNITTLRERIIMNFSETVREIYGLT